MRRDWRLYAQYKMDQWFQPFAFRYASTSSNNVKVYAKFLMINKVPETIFKNWQVA